MHLFLFPQCEEGGGHGGQHVVFIAAVTDEALGRHGVLEPGTFLLQKSFRIAELGQKVREVPDAPD